MGHLRARIAAVVAIAAGGLVTWSPSAQGLSCAPYEGTLNAEAFVRDEGFRNHYDYTLVGTVLAVRALGTNARVLFGVAATIERPDPPATVEVWAHDPMGSPDGWFEVGAGYIVPLRARGPAGQLNYLEVCTPMLRVDDPYAVVDQLNPVTIEYGIVFMRPVVADTPAPRGRNGANSSVPAALAGLGAGCFVGAVGGWLLRRR